jgi:hypothetical protein
MNRDIKSKVLRMVWAAVLRRDGDRLGAANRLLRMTRWLRLPPLVVTTALLRSAE